MFRSPQSWQLSCTVLVVVALLGGGWWWWSATSAPDDPRGDTMQILVPAAMTVTPRVHMLGRLHPSVAYVVETSAGLVLIDAGLEASAESVQAQFAELQLDVSELKLILLTHMHGDHVLGAQRLRALTGAKIHAGQGDAAHLRGGGPREALLSTYELPDVVLHPTDIDVELRGGETLTLGDVQLEVIATPGHTPGSLCFLLHIGQQRILFTGDTVSSLVGELGTYSAYLPPRYFGSAADYVQSLQRLKSLPAPDLILTGHPTELGIPHSPRVPAATWHSVLDRGIREMEVLATRFAQDGADFLDGEPKTLVPGLHYLGDRDGHAVYVLETATQLLLFDAPGGAGLAAFVAERLRDLGVAGQAPSAVLLTTCDPRATSGLAELVAETNCLVVAAAAGHSVLQPICPPDTKLLSAADPEVTLWFRGQVLPLEGRGVGPTAYLIQMDDRKVLIGGEFPLTLGPESVQRLQAALQAQEAELGLITRSLVVLRRVQPAMWLPAYPLHGQNANLYEGQWDKVIQDLLALFPG